MRKKTTQITKRRRRWRRRKERKTNPFKRRLKWRHHYLTSWRHFYMPRFGFFSFRIGFVFLRHSGWPSVVIFDSYTIYEYLTVSFLLCVLYENQISIQLLPHNTHFDSFACTLTCYCGVIGYFAVFFRIFRVS